MPDFIMVTQDGETYEIYADGIVYHTSADRELPETDIPALIFKLRDTYLASLKA